MAIPNNDVTTSIQLALAPVFLLMAVVTLFTAISGRLARSIDRMRYLHQALLSSEKLNPVVDAHYRVEFRQVKLRGRLCALAVMVDVLSGVLISLTVLELFELGTTHLLWRGYVVATFVAGLLCFMVALFIMLVEVVYAHRSAVWNLPID